ncbi:MAG: ABC transporter substrate-binding protein [Clostridiales Family XIII bacterium]|jgi:iron complex transport system substrate-binding protein|nr:ABC transporter substrate-binding protein [Clostridiales Family XIII bacterium]
MFKKIIAAALCAVMFLVIAGGCAKDEPAAADADTVKTEEVSETRTVVDHNGDTVTIPTEINRIAVTSIYPLPAFISMYLGSAEKIIAMHSVSMAAAENGVLGKLFPEILTADTGWMQGDVINTEELLKLDPDVVFYSASSAAEKEALANAGIPAIGVHATKWDFDAIVTFDKWVDVVSQVFPGESRVEGVSDYSNQVLAEITEKVKDIPDADRRRAMFLFQYDDTVMITSGKNFFGQYWISAAGGINVAEGMTEAGSNAVINMEQVYEWDPDIIYITNFTPAQPNDLYTNNIAGDDWSGVTAVKNKQVFKLPLGAYRTYTPGIDTPQTLKWMAKTMYPEIFADVDLSQEVKDYYSEFFGITLSDDDIQMMYNPSGDAGVAGFMKK